MSERLVRDIELFIVSKKKVLSLWLVGIGRRKAGNKDDVYEVTQRLLTEMLQQPEKDQ